ncbi:leucine rich repeat containing 66 [Amia ocellicauda]|uniref:leucine rich repeat containing 66 n=1 Tax=Amia ocellicauda TaxID=2972642 RepID=UPI0034644104
MFPVALLLLLCALSTPTALQIPSPSHCPAPCLCEAPAVMNCSATSLSSLPRHVPPSVTLLDLTHNSITSLTLRRVSGGGWGVTQLRLGHNRIRGLALCAEGTRPAVGTMAPADNSLVAPAPSQPTRLGRCRTWAPNLQLLSLEQNQLSTIPEGLGWYQSLQVLELSHNRISAVRMQDLQSCTKITALYLQHNMISTIDPLAFKDLRELKVLNLSYNALTTIPSTAYHSLRNLHLKVDVTNNNWICDCDLLTIKKWMGFYGGVSNQAWHMICKEPSHLSGKDLLNVEDSELVCETPASTSGLLQEVTLDMGITMVLPCRISDKDSAHTYWWTPHGQVSKTSQSYFRLDDKGDLVITDVKESDEGLYVCVAGEDQGSISVLDVHVRRNSPVQIFRRTRDIGFPEERTQSEFILAVCLSVFITFICAFCIGAVVRPFLDVLWKRIRPQKKTATDCMHENKGFSGDNESIQTRDGIPFGESHPMCNRFTFDHTQQTNTPYYVTVLPEQSGSDNLQGSSSKNSSISSTQGIQVTYNKTTGDKPGDYNIYENIAASTPPKQPFHTAGPNQHIKEEESLSTQLQTQLDGTDISEHSLRDTDLESISFSGSEGEDYYSSINLQGQSQTQPRYNVDSELYQNVADVKVVNENTSVRTALQPQEDDWHNVNTGSRIPCQQPPPTTLSPIYSEAENSSVNTEDTGDLEFSKKGAIKTIWEAFSAAELEDTFEQELDRSGATVQVSQGSACEVMEDSQGSGPPHQLQQENDSLNIYHNLNPRPDSFRENEDFGGTIQNVISNTKEAEHDIKGNEELTEVIQQQWSPESGMSFEFSDSDMEDKVKGHWVSDFNSAQQVKMEAWPPFDGSMPDKPKEAQENVFHSSPKLLNSNSMRQYAGLCGEGFSEEYRAENVQSQGSIKKNKELSGNVQEDDDESVAYRPPNSSHNFNKGKEHVQQSGEDVEKATVGIGSTVLDPSDLDHNVSVSETGIDAKLCTSEMEELPETNSEKYKGLDNAEDNNGVVAEGWTVFEDCHVTAKEPQQWSSEVQVARDVDFSEAFPPRYFPQPVSYPSTQSPEDENLSDFTLPTKSNITETLKTAQSKPQGEGVGEVSSLTPSTYKSSGIFVAEDVSKHLQPVIHSTKIQQIDRESCDEEVMESSWLTHTQKVTEPIKKLSHAKQKLDWTKGGFFVQKRKAMDNFTASSHTSMSKNTENPPEENQAENTLSTEHKSFMTTRISGAGTSEHIEPFSTEQFIGMSVSTASDTEQNSLQRLHKETTDTDTTHRRESLSSDSSDEQGCDGKQDFDDYHLSINFSNTEEKQLFRQNDRTLTTRSPTGMEYPPVILETSKDEGSEA